MPSPIRYVSAERRTEDDFHEPFTMKEGETVFDAKTKAGPWATMTQRSFAQHSMGKLGTGYCQKYERQKNGELHKVDG